jgi:hypothetical protein
MPSVVVCGSDGVALSEAVAARRSSGGRVAVMVGVVGDPEVQTAALAMAAELFGDPAVVVTIPSGAGRK